MLADRKDSSVKYIKQDTLYSGESNASKSNIHKENTTIVYLGQWDKSLFEITDGKI